MIIMRHPETGGVAPALEEAFDVAYAIRGWVKLDVTAEEASGLTGFVVGDLSELDPMQLRELVAKLDARDQKAAELENEKKAELQADAKKLGLDTKGTNDELRARILEATVPTDPAASGAAQAGSSSDEPATPKRSAGGQQKG